MRRRPPASTLFHYTTLFRSILSPARLPVPPLRRPADHRTRLLPSDGLSILARTKPRGTSGGALRGRGFIALDRKSTRLNSSAANIPHAVFCLKNKEHVNLGP